ncbi:MAG TPA: response regulator [Acidobacteriota bacterium]|nr:response regulator [Acidobacteriota bacterium]
MSNLSGKKILLVEDDLLSTELLLFVFQSEGIEVKTATNVSDALLLLKDWIPDVIISDLGLPDEDGFAFIKKIRSMTSMEYLKIPAVAVTGYGREEGLKALEAGFTYYRTKPLQPHDLITMLRKMLNKT